MSDATKDNRSASQSPLRLVWGVRSFEEFWPLYLREHSQKLTRWLHVGGTICGVSLVVAACFGGVWFALAGVFGGYGLAWYAHFKVERNRPATFSHPWWSFRGDMLMTWLFLTGRLDAELRRLGIGLS